jgi:hypothetical protein
MSDFRATATFARSSIAYLMVSALVAVALEMAAADAADASPITIAAVSASPDHSAIAADAAAAGDVETVEMSVAAYDRVSIAVDRVLGPALSR